MRKLSVFVVWCLAVFPTCHAGTVRYVSSTGSARQPYLSWDDASGSLQAAANVCADGDTILVGAGRYALGNEILVTNAITIRGAEGPDATVITGSSTNRCFHLTHPDIVLEGLTITGGSDMAGGGVSCIGGTIRNCVIKGNQAPGGSGGGIEARGALTVMDSRIEANHADFAAGIKAHGPLVLESCVITGNVARVDGGGIEGGSRQNVHARNCTISGNIASRDGGGIDTAHETKLRIEKSKIKGNKATDSRGGGVHVTGTASATLRQCNVTCNKAGKQGGGIFNWGTASLIECDVTENVAAVAGGGVCSLEGRDPHLDRSVISRNSAASGADVGTLSKPSRKYVSP